MFKRRNLDYLFIPDSSGKIKKQRLDRAKLETKRRKINKIVVMKGRDSEEDILNIGKILKEGDIAGIDTFPLHFLEYKEIIRKAKKEGKFPRKVKIIRIATDQTFKEFIYGILGFEEEKLRNNNIEYLEKRHDYLWRLLKSKIKDLISF